MQKLFGWFLVGCSGLTILYNVVQNHENERQVNEHPFVTLFSGGENLKHAYNFLPPYTGFETIVIAVLIIGGIVIFTSAKQRKD